ncbi:MAG: YbaN family protein [Candidatus Omnitrophica bacterium]|nr:YbaN family protein [Candidatus Omnitrophota bacterium]
MNKVPEKNNIKRILLLSLGFVLTALGLIGIIIPIMPTIPFLVLASVCFSHSSKRFNNMLLRNKWVGPQIKKYEQGKGISLKTKVMFVLAQAGGIAIVMVFVPNTFSKILLIGIAVAFAIYILSLKTLPK